MESSVSIEPAKLEGIPDARLAPVTLFEATFLPFVGLMLGSLVVALVAIYNALMVRRFDLAVSALAVGVICWWVAARTLGHIGVTNPYLLILLARGIGIIAGLILMRSQQHLVRGHEYLEGRTFSLVACVVVVFVGTIFVLRGQVIEILLGLALP